MNHMPTANQSTPTGSPPSKPRKQPATSTPAWQPADLIVLLFATGLAWAHLPHPDAVTDDPAVIAHRRAAAVEAATRIIANRD